MRFQSGNKLFGWTTKPFISTEPYRNFFLPAASVGNMLFSLVFSVGIFYKCFLATFSTSAIGTIGTSWNLRACHLGENFRGPRCKPSRLGQERVRSWKNFSILQQALYSIMFFLASTKTGYFGIVILEKAKIMSSGNGEQGNIVFLLFQ